MTQPTRYVYGPVPSRRLGQSLGVDPIPFKTCNYNCVYCQLGRTRPLTCKRNDYLPPQEVLAQVGEALARHKAQGVDYVTLVGQGEPTLCASLGGIIRGIAEMTPLPIAVITNGALLCQPEVREALYAAQVVMPSLDAADQASFRRINRPCPGLQIEKIIEGMAEFRQSYDGEVWVEVMLLEGLNDDEAHVKGLRQALERIGPQRVQINVPVRPPAEAWVQIPTEDALMRAKALLGEVAEVVVPYEGRFELDETQGLAESILAIIRRHPMREERMLETLTRYAPEKVQETLARLEEDGLARRRIHGGQAFWESAQVQVGDQRRR